MWKKLLLSAGLVFSASYCYSESISPYYGYTNNAAATGLTWGMSGLLPEVSGLDIQNVIYSYRIQKELEDAVTVHVQNKNANSTGYVFRETDIWSTGSISGTQINKAVPVIPNIPQSSWGQGSIEVEGSGSVTDARVVYTYKVNPCYNAQFDPNCPGYVIPVPTIYELSLDDIYDVTDDENVNLDNEKEIARVQAEDEALLEKEKEEEEKERKVRIQRAEDSLEQTDIIVQSQIISQMNNIANLAAISQGYYSSNIPGGVYNESVNLIDAKLPENKSALRNGLAQQLLHTQMVAAQYK